MIVLLVESPWLVLNTPFLLITNHGELKTSRYRKRGFNTGYSPFSSHFGWTKPVVSPTMSPHFSPINGRNRGRPSPKKGTDLSPGSCHAVMPGTLHDYHFGSRGIYNVEVFFFGKDNCAENSWHFLKTISSWSTMRPGTGPSKSSPVFPHWMADWIIRIHQPEIRQICLIILIHAMSPYG